MVLKPGQMIGGRFMIREELGRGGVGVVYRADDAQRGHPVALKMLLAQHHKNTLAVARFKREVEICRTLDHPAIVKVFDAGRVGENLFYSMEFVEGQSVHAWLKQHKRMSYDTALGVLCQVAHALEHAHRFVVHRDVSSDNIILLGAGSIKILDFGQARLESASERLTTVGVTLGKLVYSSPEQRTDAATVDKRTDIYAMGVLFYEMVTGRYPMPYLPMTSHTPLLPEAFEPVVQRMMAKEAHHRYESALESSRALCEAVGQPAKAGA